MSGKVIYVVDAVSNDMRSSIFYSNQDYMEYSSTAVILLPGEPGQFHLWSCVSPPHSTRKVFKREKTTRICLI